MCKKMNIINYSQNILKLIIEKNFRQDKNNINALIFCFIVAYVLQTAIWFVIILRVQDRLIP